MSELEMDTAVVVTTDQVEEPHPLSEGAIYPLVDCFTPTGELAKVRQHELIFSPAVYGLLIENGRILLQTHSPTELLILPGGLVTAEQTAQQAVRQHFRATTGITPDVRALVAVEEHFRVDEAGQGWHLNVLYYALLRPPMGRTSVIDFENAARPEWVSLQSLTPPKLFFGYAAIQAAARLSAT